MAAGHISSFTMSLIHLWLTWPKVTACATSASFKSHAIKRKLLLPLTVCHRRMGKVEEEEEEEEEEAHKMETSSSRLIRKSWH